MNLFENQNYYNKETFDKVSYEDQKELFLRIRSWVATVDNETRYVKEKFKKVVIKRIEQICAYACSGHIPSQDYMGYVYKRGFADFFPINYKRSIEWNVIAAANGSKLAPQKMKAFMNPAIDMILHARYIAEFVGYEDNPGPVGDLNADGLVGITDQMILTRYWAGWSSYELLPYFN